MTSTPRPPRTESTVEPSSCPLPNRNAGPRRWYHTPFVFLLIAIPATSVIMGTTYAVISFRVFDGVVVDDYYQRGKTINLVLARDLEAARLGLSGILTVAAADGQLRLDLNSATTAAAGASGESTDPTGASTAASAALPAALELSFLHATRAGHDRTVRLARHDDGSYRGQVETLANGKYHLQLETAGWRLVGKLRAPGERVSTLSALPTG